MHCLVGCFAVFAPRVTLVLVYFFSDLLQNAYETLLWPVLGFFFMPLTTLAYAWSVRGTGSVQGWHYALMTLAVLFDLGLIGRGARARKEAE